MLDLNDTQTAVLSLVFKYCDDNELPLLDLPDLRTTLQFLASDEGKPILATYGGMSQATVGVLLRSIVTLEQEGADVFFGEPEFDVADLMRTTPDGTGIISVLELSDVMDQAAAVQHLHAVDAGAALSRAAGGGRPAEAQARASSSTRRTCCSTTPRKALMDQVELTVRLIRSKGVGVYFVTQAPTDVPAVACSRSWATGSSTRCGRSRPRTPTTCARPRARSR